MLQKLLEIYSSAPRDPFNWIYGSFGWGLEKPQKKRDDGKVKEDNGT